MDNSIATHKSPVWRLKSNFLIQADLGSYGMANRREQLWVRKIDEYRFEICCLPFFTYGIALGDVVETNEQHVVQRVVTKSGHRVLRIAVSNNGDLIKLHELIHSKLKEDNLNCEWYATGYVAVDISSNTHTDDFVRFLEKFGSVGDLHFEFDS